MYNFSIELARLGRLMRILFPKSTTSHPRNKLTGKQETAYVNVDFQDQSVVHTRFERENISLYIPPTCHIQSHMQNWLTLSIPTEFIINGNILFKKITLKTSTWHLSIRGKDIVLEDIGLDNSFCDTVECLQNTLKIAEKIKVCTGVTIMDVDHLYLDVNRKSVLLESVALSGDENTSVTKLRHVRCEQSLKWDSMTQTCRTCQKRIDIRTDLQQICDEIQHDDESISLHETDQEDLGKIFETVFLGASSEMKLLMQSQAKALSCTNRKSIRWDKKILSLCLSLWIRSPSNYQQLRESNVLIMPSGRQLRKYKNQVPQCSGISEEILHWMYTAAKEQNLEESGYSGGLVHDETKIQEGLVLSMKGGYPNLIGWVDTGEENMHANVLRNNTMQARLASHVLQVVFIGYTGFRFPVCHFPTTGVTASELHTILWSVIKNLYDWGFYVDFIIQDGGQENRQFIKSNFTGDPLQLNYVSPNLVDPSRQVAHVQDFSHNIKKLRNSILSSGHRKFCKRVIQKDGQEIIWDHWKSAVQWDRDVNARPICHKITDTHLNPNSAEKMRNHLAEEMLNEDFLHLMECFQANLNEGAYLNSSIQLLKQTSKLIKFFRDQRPVTSLSDQRLDILKSVFDWFQEWKQEIAKLKSAGVNTSKMMISYKCLEDIESMLLTFKEICRIHLTKYPNGYVVPSRINSDIVENHFCQQRGMFNGCNTHPTYSNYCTTVNSVILGQSLKSRGRKSNAGLSAASCYNISTNMSLNQIPAKKLKLLKDMR